MDLRKKDMNIADEKKDRLSINIKKEIKARLFLKALSKDPRLPIHYPHTTTTATITVTTTSLFA